uniref:Uncharacterized protein n=1 Tax=Anguilla anguilla TaxID=7936 RepID=A0A0E9PC32_ANGAN
MLFIYNVPLIHPKTLNVDDYSNICVVLSYVRHFSCDSSIADYFLYKLLPLDTFM